MPSSGSSGVPGVSVVRLDRNNEIISEDQLYLRNTSSSIQDDDGESERISSITLDDNGRENSNSYKAKTIDSDLYTSIFHSANLYSNREIKNKLYNETFRYGMMNPYSAISNAREYLFFTKPDLNIYDTSANLIPSNNLQDFLANIPFWAELAHYRKDTTLKALQLSRDVADPFNHLLQNCVISNLDIPGLSSDTIDTPTNMYGVGYSYRGSSEASDDNPEFSLEFKDNRYLDVYTFFKAYEEYETLKHHGVIKPSDYYITRKILHDQFSIYKFIVGDDMETILYYGKMYGVMPKSLPRDVFSNPNFDNGLSYSIDFKAAFYEDMKPDILADFNSISAYAYNSQKYQINPYNQVMGRADTRPAKAAAVIRDTTSATAINSSTGYVYKLKWRVSESI
jgi:hypothetical protein